MRGVERGEGANKPDWPVDCNSSLKTHQSCDGADLMAHLQVKIAQRTASLIIFMCKQAGTNSRCQGTFPPLSNCSFILLSTYPIQKYTKTYGDSFKWQIKPLMCHICTGECKGDDGGIKMKRFWFEMFSGSESHDQDSVATAANVVREAIVLMSVHEERANVGRSIQAENAEASSLLSFSTNLSDKEQRERPRPTWVS